MYDGRLRDCEGGYHGSVELVSRCFYLNESFDGSGYFEFATILDKLTENKVTCVFIYDVRIRPKLVL